MQNQLIKASDVDDTQVPDPNVKVTQVETNEFGRKVWKVEKIDEDAEKEDNSEQDESEDDDEPQLNFLQKRNADLKIDQVVGKKQQISKDANLRDEGVYRCKLCDCVCKDSLSWLDHLNGKKHNQMLGMSMKVERVNVDKVKEKFASLKKKQTKAVNNFEDFEAKFQEEQEMKKERKKQNKLKKKQLQQQQQQLEQQEAEEDDEMALMAQMGLPVNLGGK